MARSTKSLAPAHRHTLYPDDAEANVFTVDTLRVYCEHTIDGARRTSDHRQLFEVVPTLDGSAEATADGGQEAAEKVTFVYSGRLRLVSGDGTLEEESQEGGKRSYVLTCKKASPNLALLEGAFWRALQQPSTYRIAGIDGGGAFEVNAYCPDRYELAFDFPAMRKMSGGVKITGGEDKAKAVARADRVVEVTAKSATWKPTDQKLETVDETTVFEGRSASSEGTEETGSAPVEAISVTRNQYNVQVNVLELAGSVLELAAQIQEMISLVQDHAPKFGWYFEAEAQVMQGTLAFKWGWREYARAGQEHRAFYWLCLNADLALVKCHVEIGIGLEGFGFELQVYGRIAGEVTLKAALQRVSPEGDAGLRAELRGQIKGSLGARFEAPYIAKASGTIDTALIVEGKLRARQDEGLRMTLDSYWNGISAEVTWSLGAESEFATMEKKGKKKVVNVISPPAGQPGFELGRWTWPVRSRYAPERLPRSEVEAVFAEVFEAGPVILGGKYDIRVREHGRNTERVDRVFGPDTYAPDYDWWAMQDVVQAAVDRVERREHLMLRRKNVEAMALQIRERLQEKMTGHMSSRKDEVPYEEWQRLFDWKHELKTPHLRAADYEAFLESRAMAEILEGYVDPIQEQISQMGGQLA